MTWFKREGWNNRQIQHHKKLYLEYRRKELFWNLDLFLSVNHPQWVVENFLSDFVNNKRTISQMFARVLICGGEIAYTPAIPYREDMERFIGFMYHGQYIKITHEMKYSDIMNLDRVFDLSVNQRGELLNSLLKS